MSRPLAVLFIGILSAISLQGCASSGYSITEPVPSQLGYEAASTPVSGDVAIRDARGENPDYFSFGVLPAELRIDDVAFEPIDFLRTHVAKELDSRAAAGSVSSSGEWELDVKTLRMRNHRTNAYTPFITLTMLSGDVTTPEGVKPIGIFITHGKGPVWTFLEVIEPIFTQPMSMLGKELAAQNNAES